MCEIFNKQILYTALILLIRFSIYGQDLDIVKLDTMQLHGIALSKDVNKVLQILDTTNVVTYKGIKYKTKFEDRFKYDRDQTTNYFQAKDSVINQLRRIYQLYWRKELLGKIKHGDKKLKRELLYFFRKENRRSTFMASRITKKNIKEAQRKYIESKDYYTTDFGKTNGYYDLLLWKKQSKDTYKNVSLITNTVDVTVNFMENFTSLGWLEYASFGTAVPGGWATKQELFCMKKSYDLKSELFLVNYLKHEGQHFSDLNSYPELSVFDLEYRAKLSEFYNVNERFIETIKQRLNFSDYKSDSAHAFSNYCVMRDLSRVIFKENYVNDLTKWKSVTKAEVSAAARLIFDANTAALNKMGKKVQRYIK